METALTTGETLNALLLLVPTLLVSSGRTVWLTLGVTNVLCVHAAIVREGSCVRVALPEALCITVLRRVGDELTLQYMDLDPFELKEGDPDAAEVREVTSDPLGVLERTGVPDARCETPGDSEAWSEREKTTEEVIVRDALCVAFSQALGWLE